MLALPLGTRRLVGTAFDLLTSTESGLRAASFYIGLIVLLTVAPVVALVGLVLVLGSDPFGRGEDTPLAGPVVLGLVPALLGYVLAGVESRALATAVIGGRAEGRPLRLREALSVVRRRFWHVFGAGIIVGLVTGPAGLAVQVVVSAVTGGVEALDFGVSLVVSTLLAAPFVYVPAGVVIGEADAVEAVRRSLGLARRRPRLAVAVAVFGIASQFIVLLGLTAGGDAVARLLQGAGLTESFPVALVIPVVAALAFAVGTLLFLVEAIAAAPAVFAFIALTRYTHGLEVGRTAPASDRRLWQPWITKGLALAAAIALAALLWGIAAVGAS